MSKAIGQQILAEATIAKFAELERQRKDLEDHYSKVLENASTAQHKREELMILREGVANVVEHHQHLRDTSVVENQMKLPSFYGEDGMNRWISKLRKEIESGKRRQLQTKLFTSVLDEYLKANSEEATMPDRDIDMAEFESLPSEKDENVQLQIKKLFEAPKVMPNNLNIVNEVYGDSGLSIVRSYVKGYIGQYVDNVTISKEETKAAIGNVIKKGLIWDPQVVEGLLQVLENDVTIGELANLMTIRFNDYKNWEWPTGEKAPQLRFQKFSNGKFRGFLDVDFLNTILLHLIGTRWSVQLKQYLLTTVTSLQQNKTHFSTDPFTHYNNVKREGFLSTLPSSMVEESKDTYQLTEKEEEEVSETPNSEGMEKRIAALHFMCKNLEIHRSFRPSQGIHVAFFDVENFSNSIQHSVVLHILKEFGVNDDWLKFFEKFLTPEVSVKGQTGPNRKIRRGLPLRHALSFLFSELVMSLVDIELDKVNFKETSKKNIQLGSVRTMDDIYVWSYDPNEVSFAYKQLKRVLQSLAMNVNTEKSGYCHVQWPLTSHPLLSLTTPAWDATQLPKPIKDKNNSLNELPKGPVRWGFLILSEDGVFEVDKNLMKEYKASMVKKVKSGASLMSQVNVYNSQLNFLAMYLGEYITEMRPRYLKSVLEAYEDIHGNFDGTTALEYFYSEIKKRFLENDDYTVPEAWLYWPVTAGGLGLVHPLVERFARYEEVKAMSQEYPYSIYGVCVPNHWNPVTRTLMKPSEIKKVTGSVSNSITWTAEEENQRKLTYILDHFMIDGTNFHLNTVHTPPPNGPPFSDEFDKLMNMFCQRGTAMRERVQTGLSNYWKWIVFNYSDQILEAFGSLEFASAGSVPIHLILSIKKESH